MFKALNPISLGIKVTRVTNTRSAGVRVEASLADIEKLRSSTSLGETGLMMRSDNKMNLRFIIIHGIPKSVREEEIE